MCLGSFCVCAVPVSGGLSSIFWLFLWSVSRVSVVYFCQPASLCPVHVSDVRFAERLLYDCRTDLKKKQQVKQLVSRYSEKLLTTNWHQPLWFVYN